MSLLDNLAHLLQGHHQAPQQRIVEHAQLPQAPQAQQFPQFQHLQKMPVPGQPAPLPEPPNPRLSVEEPYSYGQGSNQDMARLLQQSYFTPRLQPAYPGRAGAQGSWQIPSSFQSGDFGEMDDPRLQGGQFNPNQRY